MTQSTHCLFLLCLPLLGLGACATPRSATPPPGALPPPEPPGVSGPYARHQQLRAGDILHTATGRRLTREELFDYLASFPVIFIGEAHDSPQDHLIAADVLRGLSARLPGQLALGLEMLKQPSQPEVDAYVEGKIDEPRFTEVWEKNWPATYPLYRELLTAAHDARIPMVALNIAPAVRDAFRAQDQKPLPAEIAKQIPELDLDDPYHRKSIKGMFSGHSHGGGGTQNLEPFYRMQVLWDETMAARAAEFLQSPAGQGKHLVILAGNMHVRYGYGIPRRLFRRLPRPYVILSPQVVEVAPEKQSRLMKVDLPDLPLPAADIVWCVRYE